METNALYIHIPFCQHICSYCDFCKVYYRQDIVDQYLQVLAQELLDLKIVHPLKTIYIGGGTPSSLQPRQLKKVMDMIQPYLGSMIQEVTIEVNPESMNSEKLEILKKGGVTRLSIGVQTFQEELLKSIERFHTTKQVERLIHEAEEKGFLNISIDLMYGLPGQTLQDVIADLHFVEHLNIQHISYYALILEEHTVLKNQNYQPLDEQKEDAINEYIDARLETLGFHKYEISNYAKEGYPSLHNLAYWQFDNYYGIGLGATSKIDNCIMEHGRNLNQYIQGNLAIKKEMMDQEELMFTHIMMSLRLIKGVDLMDMKKRYHGDFLEKYQTVIQRYVDLQMLVIEENRLRCTLQSIKLLNSILLDFMP